MYSGGWVYRGDGGVAFLVPSYSKVSQGNSDEGGNSVSMNVSCKIILINLHLAIDFFFEI